MLKSLQVIDYALIEKIDVEFGAGLNIITGETGAGKSILIDAMGLILGDRASTEVVRKGAAKSIVEGIFEVESNKKVKALLEENEIEFYPELIIRREISAKGTNRCFINDTPVPLTLIKDAGKLLVDLHGQHEHQSLLRNETHIEFLDEFGNLSIDLENYRKIFSELKASINELKTLKEKEISLKEKKDLYAFQINEIDAVSPAVDEEEKLLDELKVLENSEKLMALTSDVYQELYETESSLYDSLAKIKSKLEELTEIDKSFEDVNSECESALTLIKDIAVFVRSYNEKIDLEPAYTEEIRERLGSISMLKKKYGGSIKSVIEYRKKIGAEFELAENYADSILKLKEEIKQLRIKCGKLAQTLSEKRKKILQTVQKEVKKVLSVLGIPDSIFEVRITQTSAETDDELYVICNNKNFAAGLNGIDEVEFYISTNLGEDPKPLSKVASGGEVSRIMLSLKSILAKNDKLPLLIFDEIDTGVSGRIAAKVGEALKSLASYHQIIAITHLPQIAGLGDLHYSVEKITSGNRVISTIKKLNDKERMQEIAKLISGEAVTQTSLEGAKELLKKG
jgi:DNA repair protein RecN (Recombination protein N)